MTSSIVGNTFFGLDLGKMKSSFSQLRRRISKRVLLIECGISSINLAEVKVNDASILLDHIRRYPLPEEAMERGVPTDPPQMAELIKAHCDEEDIPAHRAAVVIPPDAVFTTLIQLPADLDPSQALAYALDPASSVQVPIQLDQTDAELIPLNLPQTKQGQRYYFLTAVPRKLIDRLLETIKLADLELIRLQIGTVSQLNQIHDLMISLRLGEVILHVELLRECSLVTLVSTGGPIKIVRLTAIREFPEPDADAAQLETNQPVSTERQIVASDRYLPLSELDIRRLTQELRQAIQESELQFSWISWRSVVLAGPNSAHPLLASLLQEALSLPVELCRPLSVSSVASVQLKQPILVQRLGRLVGLGLSFLDQSVESKLENLPVGTLISEQPEQAEQTGLDGEKDGEALVLIDSMQSDHDSKSSAAFIESLASTPSPEDFRLEESQADALPELMISRLPHETSRQDFATDEKNDEGKAPILFSFSDEIDGLGLDEIALEKQVIQGDDVESNLSLEKEDEDSPFSMGDLMISFQARQVEQPEGELPVPAPRQSIDEDPVEAGEKAYLADDPSLWPSVSKDVDVSTHENDSL